MPVEVDETYVGGRSCRRRHHGRYKSKPDDVVLGMVERGGGRLKLIPVADAKSSILKPQMEKHISASVGTIYTDGHPIYVFAVKDKWPGKHETIGHTRTYGIGETHTNTIENAFSLLKRGYMARSTKFPRSTWDAIAMSFRIGLIGASNSKRCLRKRRRNF
jgi:ISXO2-like transposase domain